MSSRILVPTMIHRLLVFPLRDSRIFGAIQFGRVKTEVCHVQLAWRGSALSNKLSAGLSVLVDMLLLEPLQ